MNRVRWPAPNLVFRRLGWGVADQAVSSLENFLLGAYVARTLGSASLGALGLAFVGYAIVLNCSRALSTDPLTIRYGGPADERWRRAVGRSTGVALLVGIVGGIVSILLGWALGGTAGTAFVALGVVLPGLTFQDSWRYSFFAVGHGGKTFANDLLWTVLLIVGLVAGETLGTGGLAWALIVFGASAALAGLVGMAQAHVVPRVAAASTWLRQHGDLGVRFMVENVTLGASGQIRSLAVAGTAGLAAVGAIRGAEMLVGPVAALLMGISQVAVPEAVRARQKGARSLRRLCLGLSASLAMAALAWGAFVLVVFPHGLGTDLLGTVWPSARVLVPAITVSVAAGCLHVGPSAGLRALARADLTMRCQVVVSTLFVLGAWIGAVVAGAQGAAWGTAVGSACGAIIWWSQLAAAQRDDGNRHAGQDAGTPVIGSSA